MSDTQVQAMHTLHKNLVSFFDELIDMFPSEGDFVVYRILVKDRVPMAQIVNYMSMYLLPEKDVVKTAIKNALSGNVAPFNERINEMFTRFGGNNDPTSMGYKKLFDNMDADSKVAIWKWLHVFIHLLEKCV